MFKSGFVLLALKTVAGFGSGDRIAMRILLEGGSVHEGTGEFPRKADVLIEDNRIADVLEPGTSVSVDKHLDCTKLEVTPGFINAHSHIDFRLSFPHLRDAEASVLQGITTETVGLCGQSVIPIPADESNAKLVQDYMASFTTPGGLSPTWDWRSFDDFARLLEQAGGVNVNVVILVGHTNLRLSTMGYAARPATHEELGQMAQLLRANLDQGAFGLSSGLQWAPSFFAENSELIELAKVVASYGGIYTTHMRSEGDMLLEALSEAVQVARKVDIAVHVSHLKAAGRKNWGKVERAIEVIDAERKRGVNIAPDKQPYAVEFMALLAIIPPWIIAEAGGVHGLTDKLRTATGREEVKLDITERRSKYWETCIVSGVWAETGFDGLIIDSYERRPDLVGLSVSQIAKRDNADPWDVVFDSLCEGVGAPACRFAFESDEDLKALYAYPYSICITDGNGGLGFGNHPRNWGTFPRFLGRLAYRSGWLSFEEALRRVTSLPAERLKIRDRGTIRKGLYADLVVLDLQTLEDRGTYAEPNVPSSGIVHVVVNGVPVVADGALVSNGTRPGRVLRRS